GGRRPAGAAAMAVGVHGARRPVGDPGLPDGHARVAAPCQSSLRCSVSTHMGMKSSKDPLFPLVESFFRDYLQRVRGTSRHTVLAYRDALRLFFAFVADSSGRPVSSIGVDHVTPEHVLAFLDYLESSRQNRPSTRNLRLTVLRSFSRHLLRHDPTRAGQYQRVL